MTDSQVFLNNTNYYDHQVFPAYPNPLVSCPLYAANCAPPVGFTEGVTNKVSAFAPNFVTPRVQQTSLTFEREVVDRTTLSLSLLNVRGEHLIRALDVNLPQPVALELPDLRFQRFDLPGWLLHRRLLRDLAVHPIANLSLAAVHQSAGTAHRPTRGHQRIPDRRFQQLQRRGALAQSPRRSWDLSAALLYLCPRDRRRTRRPCRRPTATVQNSYNPAAKRGPA